MNNATNAGAMFNSASAGSDSCTSASCGWIAAAVAALCYGSFGVPVKMTKGVDVHPFILQSYKTMVMFLASWMVPVLGFRISFTPWGLLSGTLWVIGGTGGIIGIRSAGMAIAVGTWASTMVLVNFVWGILIFKEPVESLPSTCASFLLLTIGLIGMSKFSSPPSSSTSSLPQDTISVAGTQLPNEVNGHDFLAAETAVAVESVHHRATPVLSRRQSNTADSDEEKRNLIRNGSMDNMDGDEITGELADQNDYNHNATARQQKENTDNEKIWNVFTQRQFGIFFSVWNGLFAGSSLVPIHYAKKQGFGGISYILSFGCGSLFANIVLWLLFAIYHHSQQPQGVSLAQSMGKLPQWHFRKIWKQGLSAGLLLALGMFGSILATTSLGQGVGNSLVQSKILISGLWGICFFKEISDRTMIAKWFMSASLCVIAIIWLSYQRLAVKN